MSAVPDGRSVFRLPGGSLLVPVDEEQPAGSCATGMREVEPGSAEYDRWAELLDDAGRAGGGGGNAAPDAG